MEGEFPSWRARAQQTGNPRVVAYTEVWIDKMMAAGGAAGIIAEQVDAGWGNLRPVGHFQGWSPLDFRQMHWVIFGIGPQPPA